MPAAYFSLGLSGTIVSTTNDASVQRTSSVQVRLYGGNGGAIDCVGPTDCAPGVQTLKVTDFDPASTFIVTMRSDVSFTAPDGASGYDVDVVADFYDTLEVLAIQLRDENDQPIPGVTLTFSDADGNVYPAPDTPPPPTPTATPTATPTRTATSTAAAGPPTPTPTVTPPCASPPCEDCENCIDDDGDTLIDRADPDCAAPADGAGSGLAVPSVAKSLDKCATALQKAGGKFATARLKLVESCLKLTAKCVQLKPGDPGCLPKAGVKCAKDFGKVAPLEQALVAAVGKACSPPAVAASDLVASDGLGYEGETDVCADHGVPSLATVADVSQCVLRQHACAVDRLVAAAAPRAGEMLALLGRDPASDLPCLMDGADGGGAGLGESKRKPLDQCDAALQKAVAKLVAARLKTVQTCSRDVLACVQLKPGDQCCLAKAGSRCVRATGKIPGLEGALASALAKSCGAAPLDVADLLAAAGLGLGTRTSTCAGLGVASLDTTADVATCLAREVACRVDQLLGVETPRTQEPLGLGGVSVP